MNFTHCLTQALLENEHGILAAKQRGIRVIRAVVTATSSLVGKAATKIDFRTAYKAGVIAVQKGGKNVGLSTVKFGPGDVLVLQASDDSPLLNRPPDDFYKRLTEQPKDIGRDSRSNSVASFVNMIAKSSLSLDKLARKQEEEQTTVPSIVKETPRAIKAGEDEAADVFFIGNDDSSHDDLEMQGTEAVVTGMVG